MFWISPPLGTPRVKQHLISFGLAAADFVHRHPKRITATVTSLLLTGAGGAFAVASLEPGLPLAHTHLVSEAVQLPELAAQADTLDSHHFTLYRSEQTRGADTPEALLQRLGLADPAAAAFLRANATARKALFNHAGRPVTAEASAQQELLSLRTHWVEKDSDGDFKRLVVERTDTGFTTRVETAPLEARQRLVSGVIQSSLYATTDEVGLPDSVTKQLIEVFESNVDFHRGLHKGDRFSLVYETLEADGEPVRAGRLLSAEMLNRGKEHQALWFQENGTDKGSYYSFEGQSLRRAYLLSPLEFSRITSGFGMRNHPVYGYSREHKGTDFAAPTGTPVRAVGDGTVAVRRRAEWLRQDHPDQAPQQQGHHLLRPPLAHRRQGGRAGEPGRNHRQRRHHRRVHRSAPAFRVPRQQRPAKPGRGAGRAARGGAGLVGRPCRLRQAGRWHEAATGRRPRRRSRHLRVRRPRAPGRRAFASRLPNKKAPHGAFLLGGWTAGAVYSGTENEEPQPQVVLAFGFLMTNCAPCRSSL
jgi:murein DD-endopeptidase MepM/ murein hydrolase activator NlpD